jgi:hypothetical protein
MKKILLLTAVFPFLFSCAALTRYKCNREYAAKKGMEDASAGLSSQPSRLDGESCEGDYSAATFAKDYNYGFQQKKKEICQVSAASASGHADGEAGAIAKPQKARLSLCAGERNSAQLEAAYEREFKKSFCSSSRAAELGTARAQGWQDADYEGAFSSCGGSLKSAYMNAYRQTLSVSCSAGEAERLAVSDAQAKKPMGDGVAHFDRCASVGKGSLRNAYERSYLATKAQVDKEEAEKAALEQQRVREQKIAEFERYTATSTFLYQGRSYTALCAVSPDKSYVQVSVENRYPDQVLIQGRWRMIYFNQDFAKITEDRTEEALLITPNNKKAFQKMTLPRDASFCRAEFLGNS